MASRRSSRSSIRHRASLRLSKDEKRTGLALDRMRDNARAYEYLCHLEETRQWMGAIFDDELPPADELSHRFANGVVLAKLAAAICEKGNLTRRIRIFDRSEETYHEQGLNFRHADNTLRFLQTLKDLKFPETWQPEITDVYDRKNIPKLVYCLHALSLFLFEMGLAPAMPDLMGVAEFSDEQLQAADKEIEQAGPRMPSFGKLGKAPSTASSASAPAPPLTIMEEPATAHTSDTTPPIGYHITWPFLVDDWTHAPDTASQNTASQDWIEQTAQIQTHKPDFGRVAQEAREQAQEEALAQFDMLSILDDLPAIQAKLRECLNTPSAQEPELSMADEQTYLEARAAYDQFSRDHFWDSCYAGVPRPYRVEWPFYLEDVVLPKDQKEVAFYDQLYQASLQRLADQTMALLHAVNAEHTDVKVLEATTFDELVAAAFPDLFERFTEPGDTADPVEPWDIEVEVEADLLEEDDFLNADEFFSTFVENPEYEWCDDLSAQDLSSSRLFDFSRRLEFVVPKKRRQLPAVIERHRTVCVALAERARAMREAIRPRANSTGRLLESRRRSGSFSDVLRTLRLEANPQLLSVQQSSPWLRRKSELQQEQRQQAQDLSRAAATIVKQSPRQSLADETRTPAHAASASTSSPTAPSTPQPRSDDNTTTPRRRLPNAPSIPPKPNPPTGSATAEDPDSNTPHSEKGVSVTKAPIVPRRRLPDARRKQLPQPKQLASASIVTPRAPSPGQLMEQNTIHATPAESTTPVAPVRNGLVIPSNNVCHEPLSSPLVQGRGDHVTVGDS